MQRILVSGTSGSGKSTLARALGERLDLPYHELDALHHGPGWVKRPEFEGDVDAFSSGERWVCEDQYLRFLGERLWERADRVVWLDFPRRTVMQRVVRRSVGRAITRRELWNGNREDVREWIRADHPIRWAWSTLASHRVAMPERCARHPHLQLVRLRSAAEARRWFATVRGGARY